jgi:hypothetical protein
VIRGDGFTVILKLLGNPVHPFRLGVTVIVATTGFVPLFLAANGEISPVPVADKPIEVLFILQL